MNDPTGLTCVLFETNPAAIAAARAAGISDIIVDWECRDKQGRQSGYDTEINCNTPADLNAVAALPGTTAWCRINAPGAQTRAEIEMAIAAGVSVILLPMVTSPAQVEAFLGQINGRCRAGILVETPQACRLAKQIASFPLDVVYVGLNDLMIGLGRRSIFSAMVSGLVEEVRAHFAAPLFGCGGLTVLDGGQPLPCRLLLQEISRLGCNLVFLRRSYKRDIAGRDAVVEMGRIRNYWRTLSQRLADEVAGNHREFVEAVGRIAPEN